MSLPLGKLTEALGPHNKSNRSTIAKRSLLNKRRRIYAEKSKVTSDLRAPPRRIIKVSMTLDSKPIVTKSSTLTMARKNPSNSIFL